MWHKFILHLYIKFNFLFAEKNCGITKIFKEPIFSHAKVFAFSFNWKIQYILNILFWIFYLILFVMLIGTTIEWMKGNWARPWSRWIVHSPCGCWNSEGFVKRQLITRQGQRKLCVADAVPVPAFPFIEAYIKPPLPPKASASPPPPLSHWRWAATW